VPTLILASTSPYRRALLERLGLPFEVARPEVSEAHLCGEPPRERALRLSLAKARAVAANHASALVIGSDQVAALGDRILDKPGDAAACREQLRALSAGTAHFYTGVAVGEVTHVDVTTVVFRKLSDAEIERYVDAESPFDCAGGFKVEGLPRGRSLFTFMEPRRSSTAASSGGRGALALKSPP
jgi:septum formation protein